jgi:FkbM family methyltransferase
MLKILKKKHSERDKYVKRSYSQSGEDLIIDFIFNVLGMTNISYLDIGAHHPYYLSNTALFYEKGYRGINIEPDPVLFKEFLAQRSEDRNLSIGISNEPGLFDFYLMVPPTLNTFSEEEANRVTAEGNGIYKIDKKIKVGVNTVSNIINKYNHGKFPEFLNLDAEGIDELVLKSINYTHNFPIVICVETLSFSSNRKGVKNTEIINYLIDSGYILYADTNINSIFIKKEFW